MLGAIAGLIGAGVSAYSAYQQSENDRKQQQRQQQLDNYNKQVNNRNFNQQRIEASPWYQSAQLKRAGLNPSVYSGGISQGQTDAGSPLNSSPSYVPSGSVGVNAGNALQDAFQSLEQFNVAYRGLDNEEERIRLEKRQQNIQWFQNQSSQLDELRSNNTISQEDYATLKNYYDSLFNAENYGYSSPNDDNQFNELGWGRTRGLSDPYSRTGRYLTNEQKKQEVEESKARTDSMKLANELTRYGGNDLPSHMQAKIIELAESGNPNKVQYLLSSLGVEGDEIREMQHQLASLQVAKAVLENEQAQTDLYHTYETMAIEAEQALGDMISQVCARGLKLKSFSQNTTTIHGNYHQSSDYHSVREDNSTRYNTYQRGAFGGNNNNNRRRRRP